VTRTESWGWSVAGRAVERGTWSEQVVSCSRMLARSASPIASFSKSYGTCEGKPADRRARNRVIPRLVSLSLPRKSGGKPSASPEEAAIFEERERERGRESSDSASNACSCARDTVEVTSWDTTLFERKVDAFVELINRAIGIILER